MPIRYLDEQPNSDTVSQEAAATVIDTTPDYLKSINADTVLNDDIDIDEGAIDKLSFASKEIGKAYLKGSATLARGVGGLMTFAGDNLRVPKEVMDYAREHNLSMGMEVKDKLGLSLSTIGTGISDFFKYGEDADILQPDKEIAKGTFLDNPSWTRALSIVSGSLPNMAAGGFVGMASKPALGIAFMTGLESEDVYRDAKAMGKSQLDADLLFGATAAGVGALEAFMSPIGKNIGASVSGLKQYIVNGITGGFREGATEGFQQIYENMVRKIGLDNTTGLLDGVVESIIGGVGSGGAVSFLSTETKSNVEKIVAENNISPEEVGLLLDETAKSITQNRAVVDAKIEQNIGKTNTILKDIANKPEQAASFVQQTVNKQLIDAGVDAEQADATSRLYEARSLAASRALGVSPMEWYNALNLSVTNEATPSKLGNETFNQSIGKYENIIKELDKKDYGIDVGKDSFTLQRELYDEFEKIAAQESYNDLIEQAKSDPLSYMENYEDVESLAEETGQTPEEWAQENYYNYLPLEEDYVNEYEADPENARDYAEEKLSEARISFLEDRIGLFKKILSDNGFDVHISESRISDSTYLEIDKKDEDGDPIEGTEFKIRFSDHADRYGGNDLLLWFSDSMTENLQDLSNFLSEKGFDVLYQNRAKKTKGQITFKDTETILKLFKEADASTLVHETGHLFLRDMRDIAEVTDKMDVKDDFNHIKTWLGSEDGTFTRKQEEMFARGFEQYMREGKAPTSRLKSVFDKFKSWLTSIYKSASDLNVEISDDIRRVFGRMLGAEMQDITELNQIAQDQADYAKNREIAKANASLRLKVSKSLDEIKDNAGDWTSKAFAPITTRLGMINPSLKDAVRKFMFSVEKGRYENKRAIVPFLKAVSDKMSPDDYLDFDLALKNIDTDKVDALIKKYGIEKEYKAIRDMMEETRNRAIDAGMEVGFIEDYFPRIVTDYEGLITELKKTDDWTFIEREMRKQDPDYSWSPEQQAEFANMFIRGYRGGDKLNPKRSSFTKERKIDLITPEMNQYYEDSLQGLIKYVDRMNYSIESFNFLGKAEPGENAQDRLDKSIGSYVANLVESGGINRSQEKELTSMVKSLLGQRGTYGIVNTLKNMGYIYTMGSPISALTQLSDYAFSIYKFGFYDTGKALSKAITRKGLTREDLYLDDIVEEFTDTSLASKAVNKVFQTVGLKFMDNMSKDTFINASYNKIKKLAEEDAPEFRQQMDNVFGEEAGQTIKDIKDGVLSANVKYLMFSELSDFQPISLAEMPEYYLNGGNLRVLYMLKSYTIKQLDIYRREVVSKINSDNKSERAEGVRNMVRLSLSLALMGAGTDMLKDLILMRKIDLSDVMLDNMIKLTGLSKYQIYSIKQEGLADAIYQAIIVPPLFEPINDVSRDLWKSITGKEDTDFKDLRIWNSIPVVGKMYYWWFGGGHEKERKKWQKGNG